MTGIFNYSKTHIFNKGIPFIIGSVFFTNLLHTSFSSKVQITEVLFALLLPFIPIRKVVSYNLPLFKTLNLLFFLYLIIDSITSLYSFHTNSILENLGRWYLFMLFWTFRYWFRDMTVSEMLKKLVTILLISTAGIFIINVIGYLSVLYYSYSPFIWNARNYPYLGNIYRLSGPNLYPTMMINSAMFLSLFFWSTYPNQEVENRRITRLVFIILIAISFLTFSKSIVLLLMAISLIYIYNRYVLNKTTFYVVVLFFSFIFIFFTHVIIVKKNSPQESTLKKTLYTSNKIVYQSKSYVFLEANYLTSKRMAVKIIGDHFFTGIGAGNFNAYINAFKLAGIYPKKLPSFDPQSTFLRCFVEDGVFGFLTLLTTFLYIISIFCKWKSILEDRFIFFLFLMLVVFLVEGFATDIMNFRHLWLYFAIATSYLFKMNNKADTVL